MEVPLHDRAEREVDEAADVPNQAENANYYLAWKVKVIFGCGLFVGTEKVKAKEDQSYAQSAQTVTVSN